MTVVHWAGHPVLGTLGPVTVHAYAACAAAGFALAYGLGRRTLAQAGHAPEALDRAILPALVLAFVGARLAHCLLYAPGYYLAHPLQVLRLDQGGYALWGGTLALLAAWRWSRAPDAPSFRWMLDHLAPLALPGLALIRLGNFLDSQIVGTPSDVPWAVVFERVDALPRHPVQLYEALLALAVAAWIAVDARTRGGRLRAPGGRFGWALAAFALGRFALDALRAPEGPGDAVLAGLTSGQWLSAVAVALGAMLVRDTVPPARAKPPHAANASESVNEPGVPERRARRRPIEAQSAAISGDMASICNDERAPSGVTSGHVRFGHRFSGAGSVVRAAASVPDTPPRNPPRARRAAAFRPSPGAGATGSPAGRSAH